MRKLKLFFLFGVTLFAASTWAADTQGPWTRTGYRTNSHWGSGDGWVDADGAGYTVNEYILQTAK